MKRIYTQVVVVGGGAGGFGVAYQLAKNRVKTVLVEKNEGLGGTAVFGGVNCWEPGVASGELHRLLQEKLSQIPHACAVCGSVKAEGYPFRFLLNCNDAAKPIISKYLNGETPAAFAARAAQAIPNPAYEAFVSEVVRSRYSGRPVAREGLEAGRRAYVVFLNSMRRGERLRYHLRRMLHGIGDLENIP